MKKFKKGDRVRSIKRGTTDIVESVPGMRDYDRTNFTCGEEGMLLKSNHWEYQTDWELIDRTIENVQEGDLLKDKNGDFTRVLGICGKVVFLSQYWSKGDEEETDVSTTISIQGLIDRGYYLVTDEPIEESIEIEGKKYTVSEIKKALKKVE